MTPYEPPAWLAERQQQVRPTEILLPVHEGIGPVWSHNENRGGWYAFLAVLPVVLRDNFLECDHRHDTEDEAWECARSLALSLATEALR